MCWIYSNLTGNFLAVVDFPLCLGRALWKEVEGVLCVWDSHTLWAVHELLKRLNDCMPIVGNVS